MAGVNSNGSVKRSQLSIAAERGPRAIVALIPIGSRLRQTRNGYWFARPPVRPGARSRERYVGTDADKEILENAWASVQADIERIEARPDAQELRRLQELVGAGPPVVAALARTAPSETPRKLASGARGGRRPKR